MSKGIKEQPIKKKIILELGSRPDMLVEQRDVGFDELKRVKYGTKGEADIRVTWRRSYLVVYNNSTNPFQAYERTQAKTIGQAVAIEVKRPDIYHAKKNHGQSKEQAKWQKAFEAMGGVYILTYSVEHCQQQLDLVASQDRFILA